MKIMKSASALIIEIADKAASFLDKLNFGEENLEFISIFAQSTEEYEQFSEELLKEGSFFAESSTGIFIKLDRILNTSLGGVDVVKIRKPSAGREDIGNVNYFSNDFQGFLTKYSGSDYFSVSSDSESIKLVTLEDKDADYFIVVREFSLLEKVLANSFGETEKIEHKGESAKIADLEAKLKDETSKRITLISDFQNYQKRVEGEKALFGAMANMGLIRSILEIHDDINLALNDENLDIENAKSSIRSAKDKIVQTVASAGVETIAVNVGDIFDKEKMEAVSMIPVPDESQKGKVIAVISSAYKYKDREGVFKPAKVVVGK